MHPLIIYFTPLSVKISVKIIESRINVPTTSRIVNTNSSCRCKLVDSFNLFPSQKIISPFYHQFQPENIQYLVYVVMLVIFTHFSDKFYRLKLYTSSLPLELCNLITWIVWMNKTIENFSNFLIKIVFSDNLCGLKDWLRTNYKM